MILLAMVLAMQERVGPPQPVLPTSDPAAAVAEFETLCVRPFPDPAKFAQAIAAAPDFAKWQPQGPLEALVPGGFWQSPRFTVRYSDASGYAPDLPHPQCQLTASAAAETDVEALFPVVATKLGLGAGRISGHKSSRTAMWDLPRGADRWRVILRTERQADRRVLKLMMLNLGSAR